MFDMPYDSSLWWWPFLHTVPTPPAFLCVLASLIKRKFGVADSIITVELLFSCNQVSFRNIKSRSLFVIKSFIRKDKPA